jgi:hypothetical protein
LLVIAQPSAKIFSLDSESADQARRHRTFCVDRHNLHARYHQRSVDSAFDTFPLSPIFVASCPPTAFSGEFSAVATTLRKAGS